MTDAGAPTSYEIVTEGVLTPATTAYLAARDIEATTEDGHVVLRGAFGDLAALNALIFALDDLGLALVSVRQSG